MHGGGGSYTDYFERMQQIKGRQRARGTALFGQMYLADL